jgi:hypothetical protein
MPLLQAVETLVVGFLLWLVNRYHSESTNLKMATQLDDRLRLNRAENSLKEIF